jgi:adenylosuccinate synthase
VEVDVRHVIVVDLGYGDAGKGGVVDWLAGAETDLVVRFNGGAQAAHNVVTPGGRHHTFAQFGAGTLHGVPTLLSRFMLVEPLALAAEAVALRRLGVPDPPALLRVDADALLTTPFHAALNRAREAARGAGAHGSCGIGIGETAAYALDHGADAPRVADCRSPVGLRRKLARLRDRAGASGADINTVGIEDLVDAYTAFADRVTLVDGAEVLAGAGRVVFEGAQGVLLDEWYGFHPHTTWSTTTFGNALELLRDAGLDPGAALRLGVTRTYTTRHGAGPMPTEDASLVRPEPHNGTGRWQGAFRVGHLDLVGLRYAVDVCGGIDALAVTHCDLDDLPVATAWLTDGGRVTRLPVPADPDPLSPDQPLTELARTARPELSTPAGRIPDLLAAELGAPVLVESYGPTRLDKRAPGWSTWASWPVAS